MGLHPNPSPSPRPRESEGAGSSRPAGRAPASPPSRHTARTESPPMNVPRTRECPQAGSGLRGMQLEARRGRSRHAPGGEPTHGPGSGGDARRYRGSSAPPWSHPGGRKPRDPSRFQSPSRVTSPMQSDRSGKTARNSSQTSWLKVCRSEGVPSANISKGEEVPHPTRIAAANQPTARRYHSPSLPVVNLSTADCFKSIQTLETSDSSQSKCHTGTTQWWNVQRRKQGTGLPLAYKKEVPARQQL